MTAEQIVRALATADPWYADDDERHYCALCGSRLDRGQADDHEPDCPWRLAVEWVQGADATRCGDVHGDKRCVLEPGHGGHHVGGSLAEALLGYESTSPPGVKARNPGAIRHAATLPSA